MNNFGYYHLFSLLNIANLINNRIKRILNIRYEIGCMIIQSLFIANY